MQLVLKLLLKMNLPLQLAHSPRLKALLLLLSVKVPMQLLMQLLQSVAKLLVPDLPWAAAIALGAIVAPPDAVAATVGPGLAGALLVGASAAKAYAAAWGVPFYGVNHLGGHVAVANLDGEPLPHAIALLVSGGHTQLLHRHAQHLAAGLGLAIIDHPAPLAALGLVIDIALVVLSHPFAVKAGPQLGVERLAVPPGQGAQK